MLTPNDVKLAFERIAGMVRPVTVAPVDPGTIGQADVCLAFEFMQHTASFKARGAANFIRATVEGGAMPDSGVVIASGGNAGLACAWAAQKSQVPCTVFLPETAPTVKVARLEQYGAAVRLVGTEYAEALDASRAWAEETGAVQSHAYDHPLIAAGAGTLVAEITSAMSDRPDTIVVAVGGGGLFAGVAAAASECGIRTVAVEPDHCRALNAAIEAGEPVDVPVDSIAADSLGARRTSAMALHWAKTADTRSVLVSDTDIVNARQALWDHRRLAVEYGAATALAGLLTGAYAPAPGERVAVVLCGANTDPSNLMPPGLTGTH